MQKEISAVLHARFCTELGTSHTDTLAAPMDNDARHWPRDRAAEVLPDDDALLPLQESLH